MMKWKSANVPEIKRMKVSKDAVDRFSILPDALIHHILSFLDMRLVVQTSLLSSKWRYLWKSAQNLNFHLAKCHRVGRKQKVNSFMTFVDRVFMLRDSFSVNKLALSSAEDLDATHIQTWIIVALERHVQELSLELTAFAPFEVPCHLFTSNVKVLQLSGIPSQLHISLFTAVGLKSLVLLQCRLPKGNSNGELILSCSVLENLIIEESNLHDIKVLTISSPKLQILKLSRLVGAGNDSCKLKIYTPYLKSFYYSGRYLDCTFENLSSLASAHLNMYAASYRMTVNEECSQCFIKVLRQICEVQALTLSILPIKILTEFPDLFDRLPTFQNVRYMVFREECGYLCIDGIRSFLERCPCIKTLVWKRDQWLSTSANMDKYWEAKLSLLSVFDCLETFEIWDLRCGPCELSLLQFILKKARVLKKLIVKSINPNCELSAMRLEAFKKKLFELPRVSSSASILFSEEANDIEPKR